MLTFSSTKTATLAVLFHCKFLHELRLMSEHGPGSVPAFDTDLAVEIGFQAARSKHERSDSELQIS